MIGFNCDYYRPDSIESACQLYHQLNLNNKSPMYISGGTEFVTFGRLDLTFTEALIDLSGIPEMNELTIRNNYCVVGAALPLNDVIRSEIFPLLSITAGRIADHTSRQSITIGGNICGKIPYREAILPFLLSGSIAVIATREGLEEVDLMEIFNKEVRLVPGTFIVQLKTPESILSKPFFSVKRRKLDKIDYPLLTLAAIKVNAELRIAISGLCAFPFRSRALETILNDQTKSITIRVKKLYQNLPDPILDDWIASADYRAFVLDYTILEIFDSLSKEEE